MISALAITHNEESNIENYIKSLSFADEIIIVDAFSSDKTVEIAKKHNVTLVQREFDNFSAQKNYAISLAKHDWVTFFDLDEIISEALAEEIKNTVKSEPTAKAFKIKRNFYFMGKKLKYSGFQTDYVIRLFHKNHCKYNGKLVHETIETTSVVKRLKYTADHYTYKSFDDYNLKLTKYSKLKALELFRKNKRPNLYHFLFRPWYRFINQYVFRLGLLDGKEGFIVCYLSGFAVFKRYIQLWTMYRNIE